jgi:tellurite resistance protein TerC
MDSILSSNPFIVFVFTFVVLVMFLYDLVLLSKRTSSVSNKEAAIWTSIWIGLSMLFSGFIWWQSGFEKFTQFQSAYWIEQALSVDNLFVFILIFSYFKIDRVLQQKVLLLGIIGAFIFRAIFIFVGFKLIKLSYLPAFDFAGLHFSGDDDSSVDFQTNTFLRINVIITIFGIFLIFAGIKSVLKSEGNEKKDYENNLFSRILTKFFRISPKYDGAKFFTRIDKKLVATKLFLVLLIVEFTDLLFAVDSIPAIFSIAPNDPFILYSSNVFAILGLRSMFFLLSNSLDIFSKLKYGLAIILTFIGFKMLLAPILHISSSFSLSLIFGVLLASIAASFLTRNKDKVLD